MEKILKILKFQTIDEFSHNVNKFLFTKTALSHIILFRLK